MNGRRILTVIMSDVKVASPEGFEPPTSGLGGLRAIHTALRAHAILVLRFKLLKIVLRLLVNYIIVFWVRTWACAGVPEVGQRGET